MHFLLILSLLLAWPPCTGANEDYLLPFTEHLDRDGDVTLRWGFSKVQGTITFELAIRTTAWVGFGFSPNGGMLGADIVIGGVGPDGGRYFTDRHATGYNLPLVDDEQSYTLLSLTEVEGHTTMTFKRLIQSFDKDDFNITDGPIKLIYAYGMTDKIEYHYDRRGTKEVNLINYGPADDLPEGHPVTLDYVLPFTVHLDQEGDVTLRWGFSEVQGTITFELAIRTTAWVGFGFSPNGGMPGADIVIGGVRANGSYFTDRHATGFSLPLVDDEQSYTLLSLTEVDGHTNMTFKRTIQTCDEDDFPITDGPIKLIYAYGMTDKIEYHSDRRGTKEVNLLKYMPRASLPDSDYMDFTVHNFIIPAVHTHYQCRRLAVPKLNGTHHMYRAEPVIDNVDMVHHMLLFACPSFVTEPDEWPCYQAERTEDCWTVVSGWGVGGGAFELPENVGLPIGREYDPTIYRLEIHYNNDKQEAGRRDNSGIRLYYTAQLRQHEVGILTAGITVSPTVDYAIPPNASAFHSYGICKTSHFSEFLVDPMPDLQVFAVGLHTHLAGRKVRVGLFRGGEQIDLLGFDDDYNFDFQQMHNLGNIKTIKPGDELIVECTYDTTNRTRPTKMAFSIMDEMCRAFVVYYPAVAISACWSNPNMHYLAAISGKGEKQLTQEIMTRSWDEEAIVLHEATMKDIPQIEIIIDKYSNYTVHYGGMVPNMKAILSVPCRSDLVTSSPNITSQPLVPGL